MSHLSFKKGDMIEIIGTNKLSTLHYFDSEATDGIYVFKYVGAEKVFVPFEQIEAIALLGYEQYWGLK